MSIPTHMFTVTVVPKHGFATNIHMRNGLTALRTAKALANNGYRYDDKRVRPNRIRSVSLKHPDGTVIPVKG